MWLYSISHSLCSFELYHSVIQKWSLITLSLDLGWLTRWLLRPSQTKQYNFCFVIWETYLWSPEPWYKDYLEGTTLWGNSGLMKRPQEMSQLWSQLTASINHQTCLHNTRPLCSSHLSVCIFLTSDMGQIQFVPAILSIHYRSAESMSLIV